MELNILAVTLIASALLVGVAGRKFTVPRGVEISGNAEKVLLKTGTRFTNVTNEENKILLKKKLSQADLNIEPEYFIGLQIALPVISIVALMPLVLAGLDIFWLVLPALIAYFAPRVWLNQKAKARVAKINKDLPGFCVTLSAVLSAGADFLTAITVVSQSMKGELSKEFLRTVDDMAVGKRRTDALYDMAARCGIPDLTDLVRRIDQSQRYSTGLADAVKNHAQQIMLRRKYDAHEKAGQLVIKLLFPILLFILLPMMGLLFFPVLYHLGNAFS